MPDLHLCPFAPNLRKIVDVLEVDLACFLENLASTIEIGFCLTCSTTLFVEFGEIYVETVEIGGRFARCNS